MDLAPDTITTEAQRSTELLLLDYLRSTNPHIHALWCRLANHGATSSSVASPTSSAHHSPRGSDHEGEHPPFHPETSTRRAPFLYMEPRLHRAAHRNFLVENISSPPGSSPSLYPLRPWIVYWALQAADVLNVMECDVLSRTPPSAIIAFLHSCLSVDHTCQAEMNNRLSASAPCAGKKMTAQDADATGIPLGSNTLPPPPADDITSHPVIGFAGGSAHQEPHVASSYAACCALAMLSCYEDGMSLRQLPRASIKRWLLALRNEDGSFRVHGGGETDIRASYCVAVITVLLGLDEPTTFDGEAGVREFVCDVRDVPVLTLQTARFVAACQTHEGGFTCTPTASEAHGAYTQCGLAALLLMKQPHMVHQASLRRWLAARQLNFEGGFNGRTNKLVDSCYSYWVGASHVLLRAVEAYAKCFVKKATKPLEEGEHIRASEDDGDTGNDDALSSACCLRAREVLLLDHAQLLDVTSIHASAEEVWDRAEGEHQTRLDLVDRFLAADDAVLRCAQAEKNSSNDLYESLLKSQLTIESGSASSSEMAEKTVQETLKVWRAQQAFLYDDVGDFYFNQRKLQDYVLRCCQDADIGGLMDKPDTAHDAYHTCYSLSGMSTAQNLQYLTHRTAAATASSPSTFLGRAFARSYLPAHEGSVSKEASFGVVLGMPSDSASAESMVLRSTSPIFNIHQSRVLSALRLWGIKSFL